MSEETQSNASESKQNTAPEDTKWQRDAIEKLATSALSEQKTARRWSIFFKGLMFAYLFIILFFALGWLGDSSKSLGAHTALIEVSGVIESGGEVNADSFMSSLHDAYDDKNTKGINDEIRRLKTLHPTIPVYAVVEDICASGGYYIAVAADKIYVDKASIVGSIGVLMDGYGFTEVMRKVGVERRLLTAGENKAMLDPFSPINPKHQALAQNMLNEIHEQFKAEVRQGRGARLIETPETFSGLFWSGEQSIKIGLADAIGSADYVAREVIKQKEIVDFTHQDDFASRIAKRIGASASASFGETLAKQLINAGEVKLH
jgi:protease-4